LKTLKLYSFLFLTLALLILFGVAYYNQTRADRATAEAQARSAIIAAQGQARLDTATANAITLAAMLPYAILGLSAMFSAGLGYEIRAFPYCWTEHKPRHQLPV